MSNTTLDGFISKLMSDDSALKKFLVDPTNGGQEHGITKAERAVLRRVTAHLSNNSKNGFGIQRDLSSYRRSLRLLQNVLHNHAATHATNQESTDGLTTYSFHVYITGDPNNPGAPYDNPRVAYTNYVSFTNSGSFTTVGQAMSFNPPSSPNEGDTSSVNLGTVSDSGGNSGTLSYTAIYLPVGQSTTNFDWYIESFTLAGFSSGIDGTYKLPLTGVTGTERAPFWFFSLNGNAISPNSNQGYSLTSGVVEGDDGEGFNGFPLNGSTSIVWQPIAPDMDYGFGPCFSTPYAPVVLGIPILQRPVGSPGETFYTNSTNVMIPSGVSKITLALNPDGTGDVRTDDEVEITFSGSAGTYTYSHDYSQGCIGYITPTAPVDLTSELSMFEGSSINVTLKCSDRCGGVESTSGYFLVFE